MAMCALIAAADGSIDGSERQKTTALILSNETLFQASDLKQNLISIVTSYRKTLILVKLRRFKL